MLIKPELLAPAGDLEKLKTAITYGADAVYIGGQSLGLRAKAKNFTETEMADGITFAHERGAKVYVTANIFAHNEDFKKMPDFFREIKAMGADAVIISDPGVFMLARETVPDMDIHISTQANTTNYKSVEFWRSLGAKRVILARELSLNEIKDIHESITRSTETMDVKVKGIEAKDIEGKDIEAKEIEIEVFVHGAMCVSYSGRCLLSSYMSGRDANRGECAQPCRWNYNLKQFDSNYYDANYYMEEKGSAGERFPILEDERGTYILNSRDLCMIRHIPELLATGVGSLKIEGRMKTPYYVATTVKAYREAIDDYFCSPEKYEQKKAYYMEEVRKNSHRQYTTGFYLGKPDAEAQVYETSAYIRRYDFVAVVTAYDEQTGFAVIEQRNKFVKGDELEFFCSEGSNFIQKIDELYDENDLPVDEAPHPQQILKIKTNRRVKKYDMLRREI